MNRISFDFDIWHITVDECIIGELSGVIITYSLISILNDSAPSFPECGSNTTLPPPLLVCSIADVIQIVVYSAASQTRFTLTGESDGQSGKD